MPLRTVIQNGDQVQILRSKGQEPQPAWLGFVATGKARAEVRRYVRKKERTDTVALGRQLYEGIVARLPTQIAPDALEAALKRLRMTDAG